ncbi:MAG: beta-galactosidase [Ginsengibacter sp.]
MRKKISCLFIFLLLFIANNEAQKPGIVSENGRHTLLVDGKPFFILGGQIHNSSAWPALLPSVWKSAEFMHLNTLEVPIYWEQIEPQQGKFDFSLLNLLLSQAKSHHVHLVLLWFGTSVRLRTYFSLQIYFNQRRF